MAKTYELLIKIGGSMASTFTKASSDASKSLNNIEKSAKSASNVLKTMLGGAIGFGAISEVVSFGKNVMDASNQAATAQTRLQTTMLNVKGATQDQVDAIAKYSDMLEKNTTISHVANEVGASQLATFGLHIKAISGLMPALDNMAVAQYGVNVSQGDMQKTATLLGKAMAGNTTAFTRYGIILTATQKKIFKNGTEAQKTAALIQIMKTKYGDLANAMAKTPAGQIQQLNNAWLKVKETIGDKLRPVVIKALNLIQQNLPAIQDDIMKVVNAVGPAFDFISNNVLPGVATAFKLAGDVVGWLGDHMKIVVPILEALAAGVAAYELAQIAANAAAKIGMIIQILGKAWEVATLIISAMRDGMSLATVAQIVLNAAMEANPIGVLMIAMIALIGVGILIYKNWSKISAGAKALWGDLKTVWSGIEADFSGLWNNVKGILVKWGPDALAVLLPFIGIPLLILQHWGQIGPALASIWNGIKSVAVSAWDAIVDAIKSAINLVIGGINGMIKGVDTISGALGKATGLNLSIPAIPQLSAGGIVPATPGGGLFNLGEGGRDEAVIPLPKGGGVGGGMSFTYAPQIIIQGSASKDDMKQVLSNDQREFERRAEIWVKGKGRKSFAAAPA